MPNNANSDVEVTSGYKKKNLKKDTYTVSRT